MATAIEIIRRSEISWVIIPDGVAANETQEAWWRGTRIGDSITFKSTNGAVEFKDINYQYISYTDEVTPANDMASFTSGYECYNYLKEQGFFEVGSGSGSVATTFKSLTDTFSSFLGRGLQVLRVNEAMTAIESFVLNAASKLSELTDGPGAYSNGKYLKSTSDGWVWSDGFNVNQNNIGRKKFLGITPSSPTTSQVAALMNETTTVISEIQTPIIVYTHDVFLSSFTNPSKMYPYLFLPGEGTYGIGGTTVTQSMLFRLQEVSLTPEDIENDPNAVIINIDPVVDGDYITKANESFWDFSDSDYENGTKSYYFSYTFEGDLYYALFVGEPGTYGDGGDSLFTEDDFVDTTNSGVQPEIPEGIEMWVEGEYSENQSVYKIINSQLYLLRSTENGNTTEPMLFGNYDAWTQVSGSYVGEWSPGSFVTGNIVSKGFWAYRCASNTSTDPEPLNGTDWVKIGQWEGLHNISNVYEPEYVVRDGSNNVFVSNFDTNQYPLNNGIVSKWEVINGQTQTWQVHGNSLSAGTGATAKGDYPTQISLASGVNVDVHAVPGASLADIEADFLAMPETWTYPTIIWALENSRFDDIEDIKASLDAMISKLKHGRYVIVGTLHAVYDGVYPFRELNNELKEYYGADHFIDMQSFLYNIYGDVDGNINPILRSDGLHLSDKGYFQAAKAILSKYSVLMGQEKGYYNNVETQSLRITGNTLPIGNTEALEIYYNKVAGEGGIQATDRTGATPVIKNLKLGQAGGNLLLVGDVFIDNPDDYTSGNVYRVIFDSTTGKLLQALSIGTGVVPYEDADGGFSATIARYNGSQFGINTGSDFETSYIFQVNSNAAIGTKGQARHYLFSLDGETAGFQVRDLSTEKDFWISVRKLFLGSSTEDGTGAKFQVTGRASVSQAPINPTEVVRLEDLSDYALDSDVVHKAGSETIIGIKDFPNSMTIPDGLATNNPVSVGQLNATNTAVTAKADKVGANDIEITDTTKGVILKSPDGTRYRITVANGGTLNVNAV